MTKLRPVGEASRRWPLACSCPAAAARDKVTIPGLNGPSELGLSLKLAATPDVLTADGSSTSRDPGHGPGPERQAGGGRPSSCGHRRGRQLRGHRDAQRHERRAASSRRGHRRDQRGRGGAGRLHAPAAHGLHGERDIWSGPAGRDRRQRAASTATVRIELRSAERRLFPPTPGHGAQLPFVVELRRVHAPFGRQPHVKPRASLFQTRSSDSDGFIVRYFWTSATAATPTTTSRTSNHVTAAAGNYTVTQTVTDNNGGAERLHHARSRSTLADCARGAAHEAGPAVPVWWTPGTVLPLRHRGFQPPHRRPSKGAREGPGLAAVRPARGGAAQGR